MNRIRDRRRLLLTAIVAVTAGGVVGIGRSDAGWGAAVGGCAALLVASGNVLIDLVDFFRTELPTTKLPAVAGQLAEAVEEQWSNEATSRGLRDAVVLPLRWLATRRDVSDDLGRLTGDAGGRPLRIKVDGAMRDEFEDAVADLADEYGRIPSGRLVILGEPGAGKTVLALLLTIGLIRRRPEAGKVPVLLSAASWDPVLQELDDWLVAVIAAAYYNGQQTVPRELLRAGMLLPVLDGLDEIPESSRRVAIEHIHRSVRRDRPIVVTCRSNEYEDTIMDGSPVLSRAPVIELCRITADDLEAYLPHQRWRPGTSWAPVLARIRQQPNGPLALALSTPLTVSLARLVYRRLPEFPDELLDEERFDNRHAIEDSLTARTVRAAYSAEENDGGSGRRGYPAARAERYLSFLARYLHRSRERDFAWWRLAERQMSVWTGPALGLALGLSVMVCVAVWVSLSGLDERLAPEQTVLFGVTVGAVFAGLVSVVWLAGAGQLPGRLSFRFRGSTRRLTAGFRFGAGAVTILAVPVLLGFALTITVTDGWSLHSVELFAQAIGVAVALSAMLGVTVATQRWLQDTDGPATPVDPHDSLRSDRLLSIVAALVGSVSVAALLIPALVLGSWAGGVAEDALTQWSGWPGGPEYMATLQARYVDIRTKILPAAGAVYPAFVVLPGVAAFVLTLLARPWPRYVLASWTLAARRRLPMRISKFLAEAHTLGLLRRSTGTYQFRHVRLQEQLATRSLAAYDRGKRPDAMAADAPGWRLPARGLAAGVLALGLTAILVAVLPTNEAGRTLHGSYDLLVVDETLNGARSLRRMPYQPYTVALSESGSIALHSPNDPKVWLFTAAGGRTAVMAGADTEGVVDLALSPDGQWLFAATGPRERQSGPPRQHAAFWRIGDTGEAVTVTPQIPLGAIDDEFTVFFSKDGSAFGIERSSVGAGGASALSMWSARDGSKIPGFPSADVELPEVSRPGVLLNRTKAGGYELRSTVTGKLVRGLPRLRGELARPTLFGPADTTIVTHSEQERVQLWHVYGNAPPTDLGPLTESTSHDVQFSADGRYAFRLGEDGVVRSWDTTRPAPPVVRTTPIAEGVREFAVDRRGAVVVAVGGDGHLHAWDAAGRPFPTLGVQGVLAGGLTFSGDRNMVLVRTGSADQLRAIFLDSSMRRVSFTLDSIEAEITEALLDDRVAVREDEGAVAIRAAQPGGAVAETIRNLDFGVDPAAGKASFAVALRSGAIEIHDRDGTCRVRLFGHSGAITSLAYSPDSSYLVSTGDDGTARVWRLPPPRGSERCD